jgi:hypothetical protein
MVDKIMNYPPGSVKDGEFPDCHNDSQLIQVEAADRHNNNTNIYTIYVTTPY